MAFDLDHDLQRFLDEIGREEARSIRTRTRWNRQAAREESTFTGLLRSLSEVAGTVTITTVSGTDHHGVVGAVGADFAVLKRSGSHVEAGGTGELGLDENNASTVFVANAGMSTIRTPPGVLALLPTTDDRGPSHTVRLIEVLAAIAGNVPRVVVEARGHRGGIVGTLAAAGRDVVVIRSRAGDRAHVAIAATAIMTVALP